MPLFSSHAGNWKRSVTEYSFRVIIVSVSIFGLSHGLRDTEIEILCHRVNRISEIIIVTAIWQRFDMVTHDLALWHGDGVHHVID